MDVKNVAPATEEAGQAEEQTEETQATEIPEVDYKAQYEEAQRSLTEKSELINRQDEIIRIARDVMHSNKTTEAPPANKGDEFDEILDGIDLDHLVDNPKEVLSKLAKKVYVKATEDAQSGLIQKATQNQSYIQEQQNAYAEFYGANPDLKGMEDFVFLTGQSIHAKNPNLISDRKKFFETTAKTVRQRLAEIRKGSSKETPLPLEKGGGGAPAKKEVSKDAKSVIDDYLAERRAGNNKKAMPPKY